MPTRPCWERIRPLLLEERPRASWMEALEFEQEAYGCTNKALPGEKPLLLGERSRAHKQISLGLYWTSYWRVVQASPRS